MVAGPRAGRGSERLCAVLATPQDAADSKRNVWGNLWTSDRIVKLDPGTNAWTLFDLPVRGTEIRHISLPERDDRISVVMPVYRTRQMDVMILRGEPELAALKAKAQWPAFKAHRLMARAVAKQCVWLNAGPVLLWWYSLPGFSLSSRPSA